MRQKGTVSIRNCSRGDSLPLTKSPYGITIIPESDLYRLITSAQTPKVVPFKDWLFEEVLPSIRKTGQYSVNPSAADFSNFKQALNDPSKLQEMLAITLQELPNKNRIIAAQGKAI